MYGIVGLNAILVVLTKVSINADDITMSIIIIGKHCDYEPVLFVASYSLQLVLIHKSLCE